ncbi:MAG: hypothetical protein H0V53_01560 [Rubrobacter sp.]|nr:hypothetical protein [Rubrobacter sp.]
MTQVKAYVPGVYAHSEELAQATRDLDGARTTPEAVRAQEAEDVESFLGTQREAGMDYFSDGLLSWGGISRPFAASTGGSEPWEPLGEPFFRTSELPRGRWFATLPSPRTLAELSTGGGAQPRVVAEGVIGPQIAWLAENGCAFVVLQETALFSREGELSGLEEAFEALDSPLPLALQLPFGDSGKLLGQLVDLPVEAIGVDFHATDPESLPRPFPKTLLAGVSDARSSRLEEPRQMADLGRRLMEEFEEAADLHLVPNGDLRSLPREVAREKVLRLGAAARMLRGG